MGLKTALTQGSASSKDAEWHEKVYKPAEEFPQSAEWQGVIKVIKARDKYSCQSCGVL